LITLFRQCPSRNEDFCSRSRHAKKITAGIYLIFRGLFFEHNADIGKKITAGIYLIFRGLFFEHNADIGQKDHLWMDTI
jgi:hypothetical protein